MAEGGRVEGLGDAEEAAIAEDEFESRRGGRRWVMTDVEGHEGEGLIVARAGRRALGKGTSPGVEGGFGQAMTLAEGAHGQATVLPTFEELSPVLFLAWITGFAVWHGQNLQDRVKKDHVLKVTTQTRMGSTGRSRQ